MWEIEYCKHRYDKDLESYLKDGWDPFAVTREDNEDIIWLKKEVKEKTEEPFDFNRKN